MIEYLGWISTFIVLLGFVLNAKRSVITACILWIIGDIGWVIYDLIIMNYSHMTLSLVIILINSYAIHNILNSKTKKQ
jgi:hypothetical protein